MATSATLPGMRLQNRDRRPPARARRFVLGALGLVWTGCAVTGDVGTSGRITVNAIVTGDIPTGTWKVTIAHEPSNETASRRLAPNSSQVFSNLQTSGTWDVDVTDDGQLGPFTCNPASLSIEDGIAGGDVVTDFETVCTENLVADAGPDQTADVGASVNLDGGGSSGSNATFEWTVVDKPPLSTNPILGPNSRGATFDVDEPGVYTFRITVTTASAQASDDMVLTINDPTITSVGPTSAPVGGGVTIFGTNFSPTPSGNVVAFNGTQATVTSATSGELGTAVPPGATDGPLTVTIVSTGKVADGGAFDVLPPVAPWAFVLPSGVMADFWSVSFANSTIGMTAAVDGTVLRSDDGGFGWGGVGSITGYGDVVALAFPHPDTAYAVTIPAAGMSAVVRSIDGGGSWIQVRPTMSGVLLEVFFLDGTTGWVLGTGGTILRTDDAGATWDPQSSGTTQTLRDIVFADAQVGVAIGDGGTITRTDDGGATGWTATTEPGAASLEDVRFANTTNGLIVGRTTGGTPLLLSTTNGGVAWTTVTHDLPAGFRATAISHTASGVVTAVGEAGAGSRSIYRSSNGGVNWVLEQGTNPRLLRDVIMFDETNGVAVGNGIIGRRQ